MHARADQYLAVPVENQDQVGEAEDCADDGAPQENGPEGHALAHCLEEDDAGEVEDRANYVDGAEEL